MAARARTVTRDCIPRTPLLLLCGDVDNFNAMRQKPGRSMGLPHVTA
jgi:uncharacterized protein (DUF2252 family)